MGLRERRCRRAAGESGAAWLLVRAYEYDGLGRLVTVLSPQNVEQGNSEPVRRIEQYLHDGEQRIAEVVAESAGQWVASTQCEYVVTVRESTVPPTHCQPC
jgi:hypothetical protein